MSANKVATEAAASAGQHVHAGRQDGVGATVQAPETQGYFTRTRWSRGVANARMMPRTMTWWILGLLFGIGTLVRLPQLFFSLNEAYAFRQTQTAFVVQKYASDGIDLLSTPLPVFGSRSDVPLEFPLFQAIASFLVHAGLSADVASRVLAIISFQVSGLLLALLLLRWHGRLVAVVAIVLFEFLPFGIYWGTASLIDFFSVALALAMVYFLDRWFSEKLRIGLLAGSVAGILAFLVKPTTAPSWSLLLVISAAMVVHRFGWRNTWRRIGVGLILGPGLGLIAGSLWTAYADSVKLSEPLTGFLTSSALLDWNFGTTRQRVNPEVYLTILHRISDEIAGPGSLTLWLGVVAAIFLPSTKERLATCGWLLVAVSAPLVFLNLYSVHTYYLVAIYPALASAMAVSIVWLVRLLPGIRWQHVLVTGVALIGLASTFLASPAARSDIAGLVRGQAVPGASTEIQANTPRDAKIIMIGCDWDPTLLYYAHREGVMFRSAPPEKFWQSEQIGDYPFMFSCNAALDPAQWLPEGHMAVPGNAKGLYMVVRKS